MDVKIGMLISPAQCYTCGNGDQTMAVVDCGDFERAAIRRHRIYFCSVCVQAAAKMLADQGLIAAELVEAGKLAELRGAARAGADAIMRAEVAEAKLAEVAEYARLVTE